MDGDAITKVATGVVGAFIGFIGGVFLDNVKRIMFGPKLVASFADDSVHVVDADKLYLRASVKNVKSRIAKSCTAYLVDVCEVHRGGKVTPFRSFTQPVPLPWAYRDAVPIDLPPGVPFFVDLVHFQKDTPGWVFKTDYFAGTQKDVFRDHQGTLRFTVRFAGDGAEPADIKIDVDYRGNWKNIGRTTAV